MRSLPDRYVEDIRIYRLATDRDDTESERYFDLDPFTKRSDPYQYVPDRAGWIVALGEAYVQDDRSNIHRRTEGLSVPAVSYLSTYFIFRHMSEDLPGVDFASPSDYDKLYMWRMKDFPNILQRYTVVYSRKYPNDTWQVYAVDEREGSRTGQSIR